MATKAKAKTKAKTKATAASVDGYIAARASAAQMSDCKALQALLGKVTGEKPRMWGPSIVGFGSYHYRYESGRTGESCLTGFAIRGKELVVYFLADAKDKAKLLPKLGPHKMGNSCLYIKRLADLDLGILEKLVEGSVAEVKRRYPAASDA
jgi:hypothetical protein